MNPFYWLAAKFIETAFYRKFARSWMANFTFRVWGWPTFPCSHYFDIIKAMEPYRNKTGIFVYTATDTKSLSFCIENAVSGCAWGHTGFLYFEDGLLTTKSMTSHGLMVMPLLDYLSRVDNFCVGFLPMTKDGFSESNRRIKLIDEAAELGGVGYDFTVRLESEIADFIIHGIPMSSGEGSIKMYCSEYVYLMCCGLVEKELKPSWFYDRDVFEPDDVYHASLIVFEKRGTAVK